MSPVGARKSSDEVLGAVIAKAVRTSKGRADIAVRVRKRRATRLVEYIPYWPENDGSGIKQP